MKKKNRKIISLLACFACAVSLAGGVAFACRTAIGAPVFAVAEGNETASAYAAKATNAEIIAGIASNETNRTFDVKGENEEVYATVSAGYFSVDRAAENGVSGDLTGYDDPSAQKEFTSYAPTYLTGSNWEWIASTHESDYCWHKNVFLKLEIKKEGYLGLTHPSETRKSDWGDNGHESAIQVVRIREGKVKLLSEEWINNRIEIPENSLLHDAGNVKTGDVVFVASRGRWEPWTYFNPVFTFKETRSEVLELEATNGQILSGIAANTVERRYDVTDSEDKVYATITAGTGTAVTEEKPFDNYSSTHFTSSEGKGDWGQPWIAVGSDANYCWATGFSTKGYGQVYLKAEIKEEAYLSLSHGAVEHQRTDYAGSKVMVMRLREGKTTVLSEKPRGTSGSTAANSLLGDVGNVRKGDVIYVILTGDEWGAQICFDPVFTFKMPVAEGMKSLGSSIRLDKIGMRLGLAVKTDEYEKTAAGTYGDAKFGFALEKEGQIVYREITADWIWSDIVIGGEDYKYVVLTIKEIPEEAFDTTIGYWGYFERDGEKFALTEKLERSLSSATERAYRNGSEETKAKIRNVYGYVPVES